MNKLINGGRFDVRAFMKRRREEREEAAAVDMLEDAERKLPSQMRRPGSEWYYAHRASPKLSTWWVYTQFGVHTDEAHAEGKKFRRRFRIPHTFYMHILFTIRTDDDYVLLRQKGPDCTGRDPVPVELLVLGCFRVLGRHAEFDSLEEITFISAESHRKYFHLFCEVWRRVVYPRVVRPPMTEAEVLEAMHDYTRAGFGGCFASMDCTHVAWSQCSGNLRNLATKGPIGHSTLAWELTVLHNRKIISCSPAFLGATHDALILLWDDFPKKVAKGEFFPDMEYTLMDEEGEEKRYKGLWILVDGGYPEWKTLIPPCKSPIDEDWMRWSKWAESLRKDVECTINMLKGRWRILKTGIRVHSKTHVENIFYTCVALHNQLLHLDGLDARWQEGIQRAWLGEDGYFDADDVGAVFPAVNGAHRGMDLGGMGLGGGLDDRRLLVNQAAALAELELAPRGTRSNFHLFRERLVVHFNYHFQRHNIVWPKRNKMLVKTDGTDIFNF